MLKIKNQIRILYVHTACMSFQLAGASWVALLYARGFSLMQIGLAESVFHVTSLLFEIPSGVIADSFGRKRALMMGRCMTIFSAFLMIASDSMAGILPAMVFSALSYNFDSGARESLAYESLKEAGREEEYDRYCAVDTMIWRIGSAAATLCAGFALLLGYRKAYLADAALGVVSLTISLLLKEVTGREATDARGEKPEWRSAWIRVLSCLKESFLFLRENSRAVKTIFQNAGVGAVSTLLLFFLQAKLPQSGLPEAVLGPVLFVMGMGGAAGAALVVKSRDLPYKKALRISALGVGVCFCVALTGWVPAMILAGFSSAVLDDFLEVRTDVILNGMIPSGQRSTLISVSSLCFSLIMIVLSPVLGAFFSWDSNLRWAVGLRIFLAFAK